MHDGARFCPHCGTRAAADTTPDAPTPPRPVPAGHGTYLCPRCNMIVDGKRCSLGHRAVRLESETFFPRFWALAAMTLATPLLLWWLGQTLGLVAVAHAPLVEVSEAAWALLALFDIGVGLWYRQMPEPARKLSRGLLGAGLGILAGLVLTFCLPQLVPLGKLSRLLGKIYRQ